ncbi:hypothetical protein SODALDRAFT_193824 [Sodiomyces alkalinus F11]|uniref:Uncharacterized protein n=1 Tax=Sodiomyces alkalinus (strain CBS 110278 / VKM F-3762 / F11) TaxID=1314773 RepID=A0A3N2PS08_SODAK|nr:hypothetical protein SODALDRAFT_193824 [Sodiomyces alkalinus F11]ROT37299.1 hypothetical protein SODALDRAFT_193824 [Sodiomyces alkalinus F11]
MKRGCHAVRLGCPSGCGSGSFILSRAHRALYTFAQVRRDVVPTRLASLRTLMMAWLSLIISFFLFFRISTMFGVCLGRGRALRDTIEDSVI